MRMDRYIDEEEEKQVVKTRTDKNQELYTDVYMNNTYVDINSLKSVVEASEEDNNNLDNLKIVKDDGKLKDYTYEEKNYDINTFIENALNNKKDDNLKRSLDTRVDDLEINSLIESINENKKKDSDDGLLSDLMPSDETTTIMAPLEKPILNDINDRDTHYKLDDTNTIDNIKEKNNEINVSNELFDDEEKFPKKIIIIATIIVVILIVLVIGFLKIKKII